MLIYKIFVLRIFENEIFLNWFFSIEKKLKRTKNIHFFVYKFIIQWYIFEHVMNNNKYVYFLKFNSIYFHNFL